MLLVQGNHGEFLPFRGGAENFDKGNVFDERNVVLESMGCQGGGKILDKRNVFDKRNVVLESMGCQAGGLKF